MYFARGAVLCNVRFGSKADMCSAIGHVRLVPKADIGSSEFHKKTPTRVEVRKKLSLKSTLLTKSKSKIGYHYKRAM
jgi:hypothetical protein